jgi:O-antigen/teichoic acid export membrane protein
MASRLQPRRPALTMLNRLRASAPSLSGSILTGLVAQGLLVVSGVLVARILGVQGRGYLALFVLFPTVLVQVGSLGLPLATTYELSKRRGRSGEVVAVLLRPVAIQAIVLVVIHAAILAGVFWHDSEPVRIAALISLTAIPAMLVHLYGTAIVQGRQRFLAFNLVRLLPTLCYSIAVLVIFVAGGGDLEWVVVGWILTVVASGAAAGFVALRGVALRGVHRAGASLRSMLRFGLKGLLGWSSPAETFRLDQAIVGLFLSPAALGLYVVGLAFANLPRFIAQSIGVIAYPRIAARRGDEAWRELWPFFWLATGSAAAVVLVLELTVGWLVPVFFGDEFAGAVPLTRILLVAALFLSTRRVLTDGAQGLGRPGLGTIAEVSSWVFLLPALGIFTPIWAARGVAVALAVSAALSFVVLLGLLLRSHMADKPARPPVLPVQGAE